ncbi:hypothetical protein AcW2_004036 [Taiwanofungus camphoratus]|nr:hypothetical protein AcW2_004036 [Antrodia cinnamomea]
MPHLPSSSGSVSSDYFDDDPGFLQALNDVVLDGDVAESLPAQQGRNVVEIEMPVSAQPSLKRARSPSNDEEGSEFHQVLHSVDSNAEDSSYLATHTYGASRFGEFGEYMTRKRAKLQIQNAEMDMDEGERGASNRIFRGLQIYINGWTEPSVQDLRQLIIQYGGIYHAYLDKKSLVTHIITCSLTPAKIREFKHMKVVRPEWLVESARAGVLLPWHDFIFRPGERVEESQGKQIVQKLLLDDFVSQAVRRPSHISSSQQGTKSMDRPSRTAELPVGDEQEQIAGPSREQSTVFTPPQTPKKSDSTLYTTDPSTPEQAASVAGYAAHTSNLNAERAMADPAWRAAHTSVAPDFIEGYYKNSRLHHLSTWKAELKNLVAEAQDRVESGGASSWGRMPEGDRTAVGKIVQQNFGVSESGGDDVSMRGAQLVMGASARDKGKEKAVNAGEERVIMHCDFDSFFVSAGLIGRPHLRGKPVVVCHSQGNQGGSASTSEIASASYEARKFGVKSGMSLQQARKLCPTIMTIPYEFQRYKQLSLQFYTILMAHADDLQAVSVDEALIDVTNSVGRIRTEIARSQDPTNSPPDPAKEFAEAIRTQVRKATGCEVSIGIAHNIMLARLASRKAKPAGSFHIFLADVPELLAPLDIDDLHGFGHSARHKAQEKLGTSTLGDLAKKSKAMLCDAFGKGTGETLFKALRGVDDRKLESDKPRKSVSCDINYGIRFENNEQAEAFVHQMAEEVARRLHNIDMCGRSLTLKVMKRDPSAPVEAPKFLGHGLCQTFNKQTPLIAPGGRATSNDKVIGEHAWRLLKSFNFDPKELRGVAIQIQKLERSSALSGNDTGQAVLPFKPTGAKFKTADLTETLPLSDYANGKDAIGPNIVIQPPSQDDDEVELIRPPSPKVHAGSLDLPSFSQVDMSIFEALPDDVRRELEVEYNRRSVTPDTVSNAPRSRSTSLAIEPNHKITVKGTNVKRITQQLAPRSRPSISPTKNKLFAKRDNRPVNVSESELLKLDIDPDVFVMLPPDLQREQLAMARQARTPGVSVFTERKVLKPTSRSTRRSNSPSVAFRPPPPPQAKYLEPPFLKQQGKTKGEKLYFTETEDVQRVIETWVDQFKEYSPNQKDVDYFAKFLTQSVDASRSSDAGIEKAMAVLKWWLVLLRRYFGIWEHDPDTSEIPTGSNITSELVGRSWWMAFREVKGRLDIVFRRRFGGCLSLK